ncbi:MAG: DNA gyrase subunit A [Candidatus Melainabacteria bacterium]|jgi:DNA gyrase subunit A
MTSDEGSIVSKVLLTDVRDEMKSSFIDYAMSIIVSRALPDVRDGLKPVHRRILYAMNEIGLSPDKPHKKCARIVGEVLGKYHPHGDTAVYDALVRLAQPFSSRFPLIDGHGNFGSLDDNPAAMRYTEARLSKISTEILADIDSETVDFQDNFDGSLKEPKVLPTKLPILLLNGSSGIAVGMATNIPPHNCSEVIDGLVHLIDDPEASIQDLMRFVKGPDFPSGGIIMGSRGIKDAFETGRGSIVTRAVAQIEEVGVKNSKTNAIVVTELPYLVGPEALIQKIAEMVKTERITGIADLNDESGRQGTRVVIKLRRDANPDIVLNNLYKLTQLQQTFSVNTLALVNGRPKQLNLKAMLSYFIEHRVEVVTRKAKFDLRKAQERSHIVIGLLKALSMLDEVVALIRASNSTDDAKKALIEKCELTEKQAEAILEMQLRRLTGLEQGKLQKENLDLLARIADLETLLSSRDFILANIRKDLLELKAKVKSDRCTEIRPEEGDLTNEDLIPNDSMMVFITKNDYIKRIQTDTFISQNRAGRGKEGIATRDEDDLQHCITATMHDQILFFTNRGVVYSEKVYQVPEGSRQNKGKALINVIPLLPNETVTSVIPVSQPTDEGESLIMLTRQGTIKKTIAASFGHIRRSGIIAIGLDETDELGWVKLSIPNYHIVIATYEGMVIRYAETELRALGRTAAGVKAINLRKGDRIVSCGTFNPAEEDNTFMLLVTDDGYGKRVSVSEFRDQKRGGTGLIGTKFKRASSRLTGIAIVKDTDDVMIATANGVILRQKANEIPAQSRMATGVRLQHVADDDRVVSITVLKEDLSANDNLFPDNLEVASEAVNVDDE